MTTYFDNNTKALKLDFVNGKLKGIGLTSDVIDLIMFEGLKHKIPFYEADIDPNFFSKNPNGN